VDVAGVPPGPAARKELPVQDHDARRTEASPRTRLLHSEDRLTWTVTEAAQLLGISRASAYEAAHRGELPVRLIGRRMLVPRVALLRLLEDATPDSQPA
jgi:excisionase family DNA binding protein